MSTTERTDSATVRVSIVQQSQGGPFGPSEYEMEDAFSLLKVRRHLENRPATLHPDGMLRSSGQTMTTPAATTTRAPAGGLATLRRLILYVLLFALVVIAASGVSGLLERLFRTASVLVTGDPARLALPLAFTLIGGPLALLLWWFAWRRLDDAAERTAAGWGLYLSGMYAVSLIIATTSLLNLATSFINTQARQWQSPLANGLVWAAMWLWHRWMWKHPAKPAAPGGRQDTPRIGLRPATGRRSRRCRTRWPVRCGHPGVPTHMGVDPWW